MFPNESVQLGILQKKPKMSTLEKPIRGAQSWENPHFTRKVAAEDIARRVCTWRICNNTSGCARPLLLLRFPTMNFRVSSIRMEMTGTAAVGRLHSKSESLLGSRPRFAYLHSVRLRPELKNTRAGSLGAWQQVNPVRDVTLYVVQSPLWVKPLL